MAIFSSKAERKFMGRNVRKTFERENLNMMIIVDSVCRTAPASQGRLINMLNVLQKISHPNS